jgi:hypothetical protein
MQFLRKHWPWIVVPLVIAALVAWAAVALLSGDQDAGFRYPV